MARTAAAGAAKRIGALSEDWPAGRVRGSVRVAARLDLWGARPIAQARSFPLIFEFGQLACLASVIGRAVGGVAAESGLVV